MLIIHSSEIDVTRNTAFIIQTKQHFGTARALCNQLHPFLCEAWKLRAISDWCCHRASKRMPECTHLTQKGRDVAFHCFKVGNFLPLRGTSYEPHAGRSYMMRWLAQIRVVGDWGGQERGDSFHARLHISQSDSLLPWLSEHSSSMFHFWRDSKIKFCLKCQLCVKWVRGLLNTSLKGIVHLHMKILSFTHPTYDSLSSVEQKCYILAAIFFVSERRLNWSSSEMYHKK